MAPRRAIFGAFRLGILVMAAGARAQPAAPVCEAAGAGVCYYISPTGSDSNSGTYAAPWKSLANLISYYNASFRPAGWKAIKAGDYIYLLDGIHNTTVHPGDSTGPLGGGARLAYFRTVGGTAANPIHIKAYPGAQPVLDGSGTGIHLLQTAGWEITGIEIRNAAGDGVMIEGTTDVVLFGLFIHDNARMVQSGNPTGLLISGSGAITVHDCVFQDNMAVPEVIQVRGTGTHFFDNIGDVALYNNTYSNTKFITPGVYVRSTPTTGVGGQTELVGNQGTIIGGPQSDVYNKFWQIAWDDGLSGWTAETSLAALTNFAVNNRVSASSSLSPTARPNCFNYKHAAVSLTAKFDVYNNRFDNCGLVGSGTQNTHFYRNIVTNGDSFTSKDFGGTTHQDNIIVEYNTFYNTTPLELDPTINYRNTNPSDPSNIVFRNNIVYGGNAKKVDIDQYMTDAMFNIIVPEVSFAQNCYFSPAGSPLFSIGATNGGNYGALGGTYSLAQWQSSYGYDTDSIIADPLFIDAPKGNFALQQGSPCAAMGAFAPGGSLQPADTTPPSRPDGFGPE